LGGGAAIGMKHPVHDLDEVVHQPVRLGVLTILRETPRADFSFLRDTLELTAGNLSAHLRVLEGAGLVVIDKGYEGRRPRTWIRLTKEGRRALAAEMAALKDLVRLADGSEAEM
jgi:DNA-binding MarR family transcriptional regulator